MTTQSSDPASYSYDVVPYQSWPYAQSHPDRLATIGTLFGMAPQPVDQARVLELGCASGGNLIPVAASFPDSQFVGVDLSELELKEGQERIQTLGLSNIQLIQADILELGSELGDFDYVICHGVYSWVPEAVQNHILQLCQNCLTPSGIAYISYNTYPGWRMRGMIRDMLLYHTKQFSEPKEQIDQARALLEFLAVSSPAQSNAYGKYLQEELQIFRHVNDDYLYHDHLEGINSPVYFHEFIRKADEFGLQYLGEAELSMMATSNLPPEIEETLEAISGDLIQVEQYMDFLRNRTFRQTLLCKKEIRLDRSLAPKNASNLFFASSLEVNDEDADCISDQPLEFRNEKISLQANEPLIKFGLDELQKCWPRWISVDELMERIKSREEWVVDDSTEQEEYLVEHLIRCHASAALEIHATKPLFIGELSEQPLTPEFVRVAAEAGPHVTSLRHEIVTLDELAQQCIRLLDGNHSKDGILQSLLHLAKEAKITVQDQDGNDVLDPEKQREILQPCIAQILETSRIAGLLQG